MCMDADEMAVVLHSRQRTARKPHRCGECGRMIQPGERYTDERLVWDGTARTLKTCPHCIVARDYLGRECSGWVYTAVEEDIAGHYYSDMANDAKTRELRLLVKGLEANWTRADGRLWPIPTAASRTPKAQLEPEGREP